MAEAANIAGISAGRIALVVSLILAGLVDSGCSTSGLGGPPAADGTSAAQDALIADRDGMIADMFAIEPPGVDGIKTGAIELAAIEPGRPGAAGVAGVFGSIAIPIRNFPVSTRWQRVERQIEACSVAGFCGRADGLLQRIAAKTAGETLAEKAGTVNSMVNNAIRYRSDTELYGKGDYWAGPIETLARASGDCEDIAILKMTALLRVGLPPKSLSLVVLRDNQRSVFHAVLAVATRSGNLILDNTRANVVMDADLPWYQPLYSFSEARAWLHGIRGRKGPVLAQHGDLSSIAPGEGFLADGASQSNLLAPYRKQR
jgi:predicted transglutaminase-like cysteine proteinase